jgi:hypothetical protein
MICTDCTVSCKSNYHTITTMMAPLLIYICWLWKCWKLYYCCKWFVGYFIVLVIVTTFCIVNKAAHVLAMRWLKNCSLGSKQQSLGHSLNWKCHARMKLCMMGLIRKCFLTFPYYCFLMWSKKGAIMAVIIWFIGFIAIMQSVPITTNVVSSNPAQTRCTWYNIMW